jgi:hypothetical protein
MYLLKTMKGRMSKKRHWIARLIIMRKMKIIAMSNKMDMKI